MRVGATSAGIKGGGWPLGTKRVRFNRLCDYRLRVGALGVLTALPFFALFVDELVEVVPGKAVPAGEKALSLGPELAVIICGVGLSLVADFPDVAADNSRANARALAFFDMAARRARAAL